MFGSALLGVGEVQAAPRYNSYFPALSSGTAPGLGGWNGFLLSRSQTDDVLNSGVVGWEAVRNTRANQGFAGCGLLIRLHSGRADFQPIWKHSYVTKAPGTAQQRQAWIYFSTKNFRCGSSGGGGGPSANGGWDN